MGNGSSIEPSRCVYVEISGKVEKIVFGRYCNSRDIVELLIQATGVTRDTSISLKNASDALVAISPSMPSNTPSSPYKVMVSDTRVRRAGGLDGNIQNVLSQVADQFNKVLKIEDVKADMERRLTALEKRVEMEGLKIIEIDKCKKEVSEIKDHMYSTHKKMIDYNRLSVDGSPEPDSKLIKRKSIPTFQKYTLSQETIDYLKQPTFDIWHWEPNEMLSLLEHMYHELGLVQEFNMNPITLKRWLLCVQENYRNNPFHNFRHCFCVTQMMYGMIHLCQLWDKMTREDLGMLITAAVCHDLDHPGYNNTYQINARTELAIRYNDISPLENHHCAVAFQILSNPETNIFGNVDPTTFKRIRSDVMALILSTDMSKHGEIVDKFKNTLPDLDFKNKEQLLLGVIMLILATDMARHAEILDSFKTKIEKGFDFGSDDSIHSLKMMLIKCCDISNEVRPFEVSEPWVDCLLEEYFNQSDREKEEGLPVAAFMDREKVTKPSAQIGFIKFVLIPMFETVSKLFPPLKEVMVNPLMDARDKYESMKEQKKDD